MPQETVAQALFRHGWFADLPLCAGLGRCGYCRVCFAAPVPAATVEEHEVFSRQEIAQGWRLACRHRVEDTSRQILLAREVPQPWPAVRPCAEPMGLAIDVGTTQIKWMTECKGQWHRDTALNPQMGAGAEVLSRLHWALQAPQEQSFLAELVLTRLRKALAGQTAGWEGACLVGNPVMLGILAGWDLAPLTRPPYALAPQSSQADLGPSLPVVYVPPLLGGFVGGDVSGGLCALFDHEIDTLQFPLLYADLGTNAEFVLAVDPERWYAASIPLGPALEGVGLSCGTVYSEKAWTQFAVGPQGLSGHPDQAQPDGLTGSGVLSLLAHLRRANAMNVAGQWQAGQTPLERRIAQGWETRRGEPYFRLSPKLTLSASDVEEVLKVKAIFTLGLQRLFRQAGLDNAACRQVHLAGNVSSHIQPNDLVELGFLPRMWQPRVHLRGNLALEGAMLLAQKRGLREWIAARAATTRLVELAGAASATNGFVHHMHFAFAPRPSPG